MVGNKAGHRVGHSVALSKVRVNWVVPWIIRQQFQLFCRYLKFIFSLDISSILPTYREKAFVSSADAEGKTEPWRARSPEGRWARRGESFGCGDGGGRAGTLPLCACRAFREGPGVQGRVWRTVPSYSITVYLSPHRVVTGFSHYLRRVDLRIPEILCLNWFAVTQGRGGWNGQGRYQNENEGGERCCNYLSINKLCLGIRFGIGNATPFVEFSVIFFFF